MADRVVRGNAITKDAFYRDAAGDVIDPASPHVSIINPNGATVVSNDAPTHVSTGFFAYTYFVQSDAPIGGWTIRWSGIIDDSPVTDDDVFTVTDGGAIDAGSGESDFPCEPWATAAEVRLCCSALPLSGADNYVSDASIAANIEVAQDLLYTLSGQQFTGECSATLRPCGESNCLSRTHASLTSYPNPRDESAYPPRSCGCSRLKKVDLGLWPVTQVISVKIDGGVVDPTEYRVDAGRFLVHLAGAGPDFVNNGWPTCQHLDRASTEVGTFEVIVKYGVPVPDAGRFATVRLACELTKACAGLVCQLPGRTSQVTRQQISFTMINASMLDNGLTGLYEVDLFIMAYNPTKQRGHTVVFSPDLLPGSYRPGF